MSMPGCIFFSFSVRDGRLSPGDELLSLNGQSLKDLSCKEAESLIQSATGLVTLVIANKVSLKAVGHLKIPWHFNSIYFKD